MNLTVHIFSFGFHRSGPPADASGNGGGFVFDCRLLPNPGRDELLAPLTGLDADVREWLAGREEVTKFLDQVEGLVGMAVDQYRDRGFSDLHVAFGCTGGRHRSVYCSEEISRRLRESGVAVDVNHCERESWI